MFLPEVTISIFLVRALRLPPATHNIPESPLLPPPCLHRRRPGKVKEKFMWFEYAAPAAACSGLCYSSRGEGQACMEPDVRCIYRVYFRTEVMVLVGAELFTRSVLMFRAAPGSLVHAARQLMALFLLPIKSWSIRVLPWKLGNILSLHYTQSGRVFKEVEGRKSLMPLIGSGFSDVLGNIMFGDV